jgi:hypothetical protein
MDNFEITKYKLMQIPSVRTNSASLLTRLILNLNTICPKVNNINGLPDIDKILEECRSRG